MTYAIWSNSRHAWWGADQCGYYADASDAGQYDAETAATIVSRDSFVGKLSRDHIVTDKVLVRWEDRQVFAGRMNREVMA